VIRERRFRSLPIKFTDLDVKTFGE